MTRAKPFDIPKREIWEAFKHFKTNQGAVQGNRIWNLIDMYVGGCGFGATRLYRCLVWFYGWRRGWKALRNAVRILRIRGPAMPDDTICWRF